jgi:hypothetical protein
MLFIIFGAQIAAAVNPESRAAIALISRNFPDEVND